MPRLRREHEVDLLPTARTHRGFGINPKGYDEIIKAGVDIVSGNHIWDKKEVPPLCTTTNACSGPQLSAGRAGQRNFSAVSRPRFSRGGNDGPRFMPPVDCPFRWQAVLPDIKATKPPGGFSR